MENKYHTMNQDFANDTEYLQAALDTCSAIPPRVYNIESPIVPKFGAVIGDSMGKVIIRGHYGTLANPTKI